MSDRDADLAAIEALRRRDEQASLAYDVEALASLSTEDVVVLPPGTPPVRGRKAVRAMLEGGRDGMAAVEVVEYRESFEETLLCGDLAVEWGVIEGAERPRAGGEPRRSRWNVMRVLRRQPDGGWLVHRSIFNESPLPGSP